MRDQRAAWADHGDVCERAAGQQVGLLAHVGDRVLGELGQRLVDLLALLLQLTFQLGRAENPAP